VQHTAQLVKEIKQPRTIVIASIHWGANWGYRVYPQERNFAHKLIDEAGVDIIHGHSSHHPKGIEVYHNKLILYGCGDFLNDYEGIGGYENFRSDLSLMYIAALEPSTGNLSSLEMTPTQLKLFRVNRATTNDGQFLKEMLNREGHRFGSYAKLNDDNTITLSWNQ
jgi:poly-gamma-glutamate capsule biosynthesis protein CapA/YwtB (metallophosphatase superfamily)